MDTEQSSLTVKQQAFVQAFLNSARHRAPVAARMAGMRLTDAQANSLLKHPGIRAEIERRNMIANVVDGRVLDVMPGALAPAGIAQVSRALKQTVKHDAMDARLEQRREEYANRATHHDDPQDAQEHEPSPTYQEPTETQPGASQPRPRGRPRKDQGTNTAQRPSKDMEPPMIYTAGGKIAGSLEEQTARLERAARKTVHTDTTFANTDGSVALQEALQARFKAEGQPGVAYPTPDGKLALVSGVKTRYELKLWLSELIDGRMRLPPQEGLPERIEIINDPNLRLQAVQVLGKSLGLFSEKVIDDEYQREMGGDATEGSTEEIMLRAEKTRQAIAQLEQINGGVKALAPKISGEAPEQEANLTDGDVK